MIRMIFANKNIFFRSGQNPRNARDDETHKISAMTLSLASTVRDVE